MKSVAFAAFVGVFLVSNHGLAQQHSSAMSRVLGNMPPPVMAKQDRGLPSGTIAIEVFDNDDAPIADADVRVGVMAQDGKRTEEKCTTDAKGVCKIESLATGTEQSYRVKLSHNGAIFSSTPFRLDPEYGHSARIRRLDTTTDAKSVLLLMGRAMVELENEKARVSQELQLANFKAEAYVFPEEGLFIKLPDGFKSFDSRKVMTDQRIVPEENGLRLFGSIAPGTVKLSWVYSLEYSGTKVEFSLPVPFRAIEYQVISDAIANLNLDVAGFPEAQKREGRGRSFLFTQLTRTPKAPPLEQVDISVTGIPSGIWLPRVALGLALLVGLLGLFFVLCPGDRSEFLARARTRRRVELLEEAQLLEDERARDEVGERFHERRSREIVNELAELLKLEAG